MWGWFNLNESSVQKNGCFWFFGLNQTFSYKSTKEWFVFFAHRKHPVPATAMERRVYFGSNPCCVKSLLVFTCTWIPMLLLDTYLHHMNHRAPEFLYQSGLCSKKALHPHFLCCPWCHHSEIVFLKWSGRKMRKFSWYCLVALTKCVADVLPWKNMTHLTWACMVLENTRCNFTDKTVNSKQTLNSLRLTNLDLSLPLRKSGWCESGLAHQFTIHISLGHVTIKNQGDVSSPGKCRTHIHIDIWISIPVCSAEPGRQTTFFTLQGSTFSESLFQWCASVFLETGYNSKKQIHSSQDFVTWHLDQSESVFLTQILECLPHTRWCRMRLHWLPCSWWWRYLHMVNKY